MYIMKNKNLFLKLAAGLIQLILCSALVPEEAHIQLGSFANCQLDIFRQVNTGHIDATSGQAHSHRGSHDGRCDFLQFHKNVLLIFIQKF